MGLGLEDRISAAAKDISEGTVRLSESENLKEALVTVVEYVAATDLSLGALEDRVKALEEQVRWLVVEAT